MGTVVTTVQKGIEPFSPLRTEQLPGGSKILDQNLDRLKKHLDAMTPVVNQITRTLNIRITGGGTVPQFTPGGVIFADSLGNLADDPAKLAYDDTTGVLTIAGLSPGGMVKATVTGQLVIAAAGTDYQAPITWPAATDVLVSSGTSSVPVGDSAFTYDTAAHTLSLTGATPISLPLAGTQIINKHGGALNIRTDDAHGLLLGTNGTTAISITPAQLVNVSSLNAGGIVISSAGQLGLAVAGVDYAPAGNYITALAGDVTATGPGSVAATVAAHAVTYHKMQQESPGTLLGNPTAGTADVQEIVLGGGLEFATPGPTVIQRSALTGDVTAPAGSNVTTLATVATAGTYGSTGSYLASQIIDAKGRTTAVTVTSTPLAGALVYTLASTTLAMGQNQSTLVMPLPAGAPIINTAAPGVALSTTLSANWGSSVQSPPTFFTQIGSIKCTGDITFYSSSGGGQPVLVAALWYVTGNAFLPGSWHALASQSLTLNIGTGSARAAINFSASSTSGLVPNDASLVFVFYRSDAVAGTTLNTINAQVVCSWGI